MFFTKNTASEAPKGKALVMIVEDNHILSDMYKFKLELEGYAVVAFDRGSRTLEYFAQGKAHPDLLLLDIMMPEMSGYDVLRMLRTDHKYEGKIIVFSNLNEPTDHERALALGADEFVLKASLTPKEFIAKIQSLLA